MSRCGLLWEDAPYRTGMLASGEALARPGGLALTRRALELASLPARARVLDIGCGASESTRLLVSLGFQAMGIDPEAEEGGEFLRLRGCAEALPLPDACCEAVLLECSLSIMEDQRQALRECARVLVPGGRLLLSDLYARAPAAIAQVRGLGPSCIAGMLVGEELDHWLGDAGFSVEAWEDHSPELRLFVAGYLMNGGTLSGIWGCSEASTRGDAMAEAMRAVRAGYFLLVATRRPGAGGER